MGATEITAREVLLTGPDNPSTIPRWVGGSFAAERATLPQVRRLESLPDITVVRAAEPDRVLAGEGWLKVLSDRLRETSGPAKVVIVFDGRRRRPSDVELRQVLSYFGERPDAVEFARGTEQARMALEEASAKLEVGRGGRGEATDPLGKVRELIEATVDLRSSSGRLSGVEVADVLGLSRAEMARLLGRSRQALAKTPDAEALQQPLAAYERVARLRSVFSDAEFRAWLNLSLEDLDGRTPLGLIRAGEVGLVAELADDMLSGMPG
ncbi:MAG: hypothetical protein R3244_09895 [Thermoanaerobaculia bacterium]|nr:hypothetical protein [Thermoanaerobaculia bacterium]